MTVLALSMMVVAPAMAQDEAPPPPPAEPATPPPAAAPATAPMAAMGGEPAAFGTQGQIAISVDLPLTNEAPQLGLIHESTSMGGDSSTRVVVMPSIDYFVAPNVSVGGQVGIDYTTTSPAGGGSSLSLTILQVEARVGYNLALGDMASLWPHVGIAYAHVSASSGGSSNSGYVVPLDVSVPVLWHPGHHFFLGAGPFLTTELVSKATVAGNTSSVGKTTDFGIQALIGGYIGG
jgi:hypothetical protein